MSAVISPLFDSLLSPRCLLFRTLADVPVAATHSLERDVSCAGFLAVTKRVCAQVWMDYFVNSAISPLFSSLIFPLPSAFLSLRV